MKGSDGNLETFTLTLTLSLKGDGIEALTGQLVSPER